jgi:beta-glucosidase
VNFTLILQIVLFTALPMHITDLVANAGVHAIVQAYYPQHVGGQAVADVLTGSINPGGRLISTWPKEYDETLSGVISNYTMLGTQKTYRFNYPDPLFPFGFGLSYTSWKYTDLRVSAASVKPCENVTVTVTVRNTGALDGSEVVQLYAEWTDVVAPSADVTLVNFERVFVRAGHAETVTLTIDPRHYAVLQEQALGPPTKVRKTPSWPRSWANFSNIQLRSHRNAWANLHLLGQPDTFLAQDRAER